MSDRQPITKKLRFEVFKRDKFTCQYCGAKAPDVILHCDHVKSVADGGPTEILNLITACGPCNLGKGRHGLTDTVVLDKQRAQLEELQERREQIEMMMQWRESLSRLSDETIDAVAKRFSDKSGGLSPNEAGRADIRRWLKRYGLDEILAAVDESCDIYLEWQGDEVTTASWNKAFTKVPGVISVTQQKATKPYLPRLLYIQGILRKRCGERHMRCVDALESFVTDGVLVDDLERIAKRADSWSEFDATVQAHLDAMTPTQELGGQEEDLVGHDDESSNESADEHEADCEYPDPYASVRELLSQTDYLCDANEEVVALLAMRRREDWWTAVDTLEDFLAEGLYLSDLEELAANCRGWDDFINRARGLIDHREDERSRSATRATI